ncbi:MAG: argininosuccinate lyase [Selenomonadaceae bacterium]|nr:argininosuccinate lyase [Selenomonadaceae bacterium]
MRGRNRIKAEMSEYFRNEIAKPGIFLEYEHGFEELILLNRAYAKMLAEEKIITQDEAAKILDGLTWVEKNFSAEDIDGKYEEIYFNVEQKLIQHVGLEIGGRLHTGRSRNDIYAALWRMETRKALWQICQSVLALQKRMLELAEKYQRTIITGYTHTQPAQPITVGYYYAAAVEVLQRDFERLQAAYQKTNQCALGAAALAGTGFPINRDKLEKFLGFEGTVTNALDCVGTKDYLLEVESALAIMMVNLSRMAQDHYIWCTNEFSLAEVGGEVAICSSIMPQKKNPVTFEMIKSKSAHMLGTFTAGCAIMKNTPFSLCMDLFETHAQFWAGFKSSLDAVNLFTETLKFITFNEERAYLAAKNNFSTVTALADFLVGKFKISFAEAHDIVGEMVGAVENISDMTAELLNTCAEKIIGRGLEVTDAEIANVLEPAANVRGKISAGSPGEISLRNMIDGAKKILTAQEAWLAARKNFVASAYKKLNEVLA